MILMKSWLRTKNYDAITTASQEEIPELIESYRPDLIIADILQYKVIHDIKLRENGAGIPVLLMSGYTKGYEEVVLDVDDVIEKPFNFPLLENKIKRLLQRKNPA